MSFAALILTVWACCVVLGAVVAAVTVGVVLAVRQPHPKSSTGVPTYPGLSIEASRAYAAGTCPHCGGALPAASMHDIRGWGDPGNAAARQRTASRALRNIGIILVVLQLVGIVLAVVAALVDIESIVVSGAILAPLGLAIAGVCYASRVGRGLVFGLSAPLMGIFCVAAIAGFELSPSDAQFPIGLAICVVAAAALPLGVLTLIALKRDRAVENAELPARVVYRQTGYSCQRRRVLVRPESSSRQFSEPVASSENRFAIRNRSGITDPVSVAC